MFQRQRHGQIRLTMNPQEVEVLLALLDQTVEIIGGSTDPDLLTTGSAAPELLTEQDVDAQFAELMKQIDSPDTPPTRDSHDPVFARLFPDAYEDRLAAADFRRYTEGDLRRNKLAAIQAVRQQLQGYQEDRRAYRDLAPPLPDQWLRALNDLRLVMSVRLGVDEQGESAELRRFTQLIHQHEGDTSEPDPEQLQELATEKHNLEMVHHLFEWVGYMLEMLTQQLMMGWE